MKPHPYLRAYMAGIVAPSVFMLFVFAFFVLARFEWRVDLPIERALMFPVALVPCLRGLWNILYVSLHGRRRLPLGLHGALLPAIVLPVAAVIAPLANPWLPHVVFTTVWFALPGVLIVYYLVWKHFVGFCNEMLGIA